MEPPDRFRLRAYLAIVAAICAAACAQAQSTVTPVFATPSVADANVDSCAVWAGGGVGEGATPLLFITEKDGDRIQVLDASTGAPWAPKPFLGDTPNGSAPGEFDRPNGVWVVEHVPHAGGFAEVLLVTDQNNDRVQAIRLPDLEPFGVIGAGEIGKGYGIAWYEDGDDFWVFITDQEPPAAFPGKIKKYRLRPQGDGIGGELTLAFGSDGGEPDLDNVESILADAENDRLHVCGDEGGEEVHVFTLDGAYTGVSYGAPRFEFDQEGINLYRTGARDGVVIVCDQYRSDPTQFEVFDRVSLGWRASFTGATENTDGAFLEQRPLPGLPNGAFYAINDDENLHVYDWTDIAEATGLEIVPLDRAFPAAGESPGAEPRGGAFSRPLLWFHDGAWWGALPHAGSWSISRLDDGTFAAQTPIGDAAALAACRHGAALALVTGASATAEPAAALVRRFVYDGSRRRYVADGEPLALPVETALADAIFEGAAGGPGATLRVAWVADGEALAAAAARAAASIGDPAPLGDAVAAPPRLVRLGDATGVVWAAADGVRFRLHADGDDDAFWSDPEAAVAGAAVETAAAVAPDGAAGFRVVVAAAFADGSIALARRSSDGVWDAPATIEGASHPALAVDDLAATVHVFHADRDVAAAGRRRLWRRAVTLGAFSVGAAEPAVAWPAVDHGPPLVPRTVPAECHDLVAVALGDDGRGRFTRVPLPRDADLLPPVTLQHAPAPGETGVSGDAAVSFRIVDDRAGVDVAGLVVHIDGTPVEPSVRGVPRSLLVSAPLPPGADSTVVVRIEAADLASPPHVMAPIEYEFTVGDEGEPRFLRGDANDDGSLDVSDAVRLLLALFRGGRPPACDDAADANDDGALALSDAVFVLRFLFQQGAPPGTLACAADATADPLECAGGSTCR